jgi:hypothetical protein
MTHVDFYNICRSYGGILKYSKSAQQLLGAWGVTLDSIEQSFLDILSNRLTSTGPDPSALYDEFGIPPDPNLLDNKWDWVKKRGTRGALFGMLAKLGHNNVSIYRRASRIDSPYATDIPATAPSTISPRYADGRIPAIASSKVVMSWFSVAIWDCHTNSSEPLPIIGTTTIGSNLGHNGANAGCPTYTYSGENRQQVIKDIAKFACAFNSTALEVFLCYPNTSTSQPSIFSYLGVPKSASDIVEIVPVDIPNMG